MKPERETLAKIICCDGKPCEATANECPYCDCGAFYDQADAILAAGFRLASEPTQTDRETARGIAESFLGHRSHELEGAVAAALASARYQKEISGISVGPYAIATDDRSKLLLNGAYTDALRENDNKRVRKFSLGAGVYIDVTNAEIIGIAAQVADHVQRCFDAAAQVADQIISENITTTAAIKTALDYAYDYPETPAKE